MSVNSTAELVNAAASGKVKICRKCEAQNEPNASFCTTCGEKFEETTSSMPFQSIDETAATDNTVMEKKLNIKSFDEQKSVFAEGLPAWSIEPPQVMVRRKK